MGGQMNAIKYKATTAGANQTLMDSMAKTNKFMTDVNSKMDPAKMNQVMMNFQKENSKMEMSDEMLDDLMDGLGEEDEDEVSDAVSQVLDEIGIETGKQLDSIQTGKSKLKVQQEESNEETEKLLKELGIKM
jgi:charged multivesicular body protein 2B